ncbi:putative pyruvate decarboxylase, partial [Polyplosphaeria fusca]
MTKTVNVAQYLFTRLRQLGLGSVHGVPGDYFLRALDELRPAGLRWIGGCNELNSGYAADGYARIKGIGALFTTYGVGELSALNAVAGAYAECSPVVHIVGCPSRRAYDTKALVHHSLAHGKSLRTYAELYEKFTVAQANLYHPKRAPDYIDSVLKRCIEMSQPVYVEMPSDVVTVQVSADQLSEPLDLAPRPTDLTRQYQAVNEILERIYASKQPFILVDGLTRPYGMTEGVNEFARMTGFPTFSLTFGADVMDSSLSNYHGVHAGKYGSLDFTSYTDSADLALIFGPSLSDTNTPGWSGKLDNLNSITFHRDSVAMSASSSELHGFSTRELLETLTKRLDPKRLSRQHSKAESLPNIRSLSKSPPPLNPGDPIEQETFYPRVASMFRPNDIIVCANGTPLVGGRDFLLPPGARMINSGIWYSVGSMLPATQGITLAQREKRSGGRTIFFEGDGSFQATAQELGTIIRYRLDAIIFIINNDGYTFERLIHGIDAEYNDVARWRYLRAPELMGAPIDGSYNVQTSYIGTWEELDELMRNDNFQSGKGLQLVNVQMARGDTTKNFKEALRL